MVEFELPNPFPEKLIIKIPAQRMMVNRLLEDGTIQFKYMIIGTEDQFNQFMVRIFAVTV